MKKKEILERNNYTVPNQSWTLVINYRTIIRNFQISTTSKDKYKDLANKILTTFEVMNREERQEDSIVVFLKNCLRDDVHASWMLAKTLANKYPDECKLV